MNERPNPILLAVLLAFATINPAFAQGSTPLGDDPIEVQATWDGGTGSWSDANWSFVPSNGFTEPNNTASHVFNVFIDGGQAGTHSMVSLNANRSIQRLTLDAGDQLQINNSRRLSLFGDLVNDGVLRVAATTGSTYLQPVGTINVTGSGVIELGGGNAWLYDATNSNAAPDHLIHSAGHSIRGVGGIGFQNNLQISNHGLIHADVDGGTLAVVPNSVGMLNRGILRASGGGNLSLNGTSLGSAVIDNDDGLIEAESGATVSYINSAHIVGGELAGAGTHVIGSGSPKRFEDLLNSATVNINNSQRLSLAGEFVNDGLVRIAATTGSTYLQPVGTVNLSGSGVVELGGSNAWLYDATNSNAAPDHLIHSSGHSIRGVGGIGFQNNLQISNHGLIHADVDGGTLTLIPNSSGMLNAGTLRASSGGNLSLNGTALAGAVIDNSDGTIEAQQDATVSYMNGARIVGGQLVGPGSHVISSGSAKRFENLTVAAPVAINNAQRLHLAGTIVNDGLIGINATTASTYLEAAGTVTLGGSGAVQLGGSNAWMIGTSNLGFLIHQAGHVIRGAGNLGFQNTLQINNQGLIHANVSGGTLVITPGTQLRNTGALRASDGGTLNIVTTFGSFASLISNLLLEGSYEVIGDSTLRLSAAVNNNAGSILLDGPGSKLFSTGSTDALAALATNQRNFTIRGGRNFTTAGQFSNTGNGMLRVGAGSILTVAAEQTLTNAGTLAGAGRIVGEVVSSGRFAPGDAIGTLTIEGDVLINDGASYDWQIDASASDLVQIESGDLSFAGGTVTINVLVEAPLPLPDGDHVLIDVNGGQIVVIDAPSFELVLPPGWTSDGVEVTQTQVLLKNLSPPDERFRDRFEP